MPISFRPLLLTCSLLVITACTGLPAAAPAANTSPTPVRSASAQPSSSPESPASSTAPSAPPSPQVSSVPLTKRSLTLRLNVDKLSTEQQALLQDQEINVTLRSNALDGPLPQPAYDLDKDRQLPSSTPYPSPLFETQVKLRLNQVLTVADVPEGLEFNVYANHVLTSSPGPCNNSATYAVASTSLILSAQTPQPLVLTLEAETSSDLSVCETTVIQGRVVNTDNLPVAGARIAVRSLNDNLNLNLETTTDAEGKYFLPGIYAGVQLEISASKAGYAAQQRQVVAASNKVGDPAVNRFDFGGSEHPETALQANAS